MANYSAISKVIEGMTAAEIAHVRYHLRDKKLELLDLMLETGKIEQVDLGPGFATMSAGSFSSLRSTLSRSIVQMLGAFRSREMPREKIRSLQLEADSLLLSGHKARGLSAYDDALVLAEEVEEHSEAADLCGAVLLNLADDDPKRRHYELRRKQANERLRELLDLEALLERLQAAKTVAPADRLAIVEVVMLAIKGIGRPQAARSCLVWFRAQALAAMLQGEVHQALGLLEEACSVARKHPHLATKPSWAETVIRLHFALGGLHLDANRLETVSNLLERLKSWLETHAGRVHELVVTELWRVDLHRELQAGNLKPLMAVSDSEWEAMMGGQSARTRLQSAISFASQLVMQNQPKAAMRWIVRAKDERLQSVMPEDLAVGSILEMVATFMLGEISLQESAVKSCYYILRSKKLQCEYTSALVTAFSQAASNPERSAQVMTKLLDTINNLEGQSLLPPISQYFDMRLWIKRYGLEAKL